jgi:hypothetical protein
MRMRTKMPQGTESVVDLGEYKMTVLKRELVCKLESILVQFMDLWRDSVNLGVLSSVINIMYKHRVILCNVTYI